MCVLLVSNPVVERSNLLTRERRHSPWCLRYWVCRSTCCPWLVMKMKARNVRVEGWSSSFRSEAFLTHLLGAGCVVVLRLPGCRWSEVNFYLKCVLLGGTTAGPKSIMNKSPLPANQLHTGTHSGRKMAKTVTTTNIVNKSCTWHVLLRRCIFCDTLTLLHRKCFLRYDAMFVSQFGFTRHVSCDFYLRTIYAQKYLKIFTNFSGNLRFGVVAHVFAA